MKLYWVDVETTGLDPNKDALLEIAVVEATLDRPFDYRFPWAFRDSRVFRFHGAIDDPVVLDMHTRSGLLAECERSTHTVADAEEELLALVPVVADREEMPVLAGSSVHFDRGFLRVHMPRLWARFSYRVYDVTAIKFFCRSLGMPPLPKTGAHRASADLLESIRHARECVEWLRHHMVREHLQPLLEE
jgi:oligoribonuclease